MTDRDAALPRLTATVLDSPEPLALARFYGALTGWTVYEDDETWARVRPDDGPGLSMQYEEEYTPPTWPGTRDAPGMQLHLDFEVHDLDAAVARAESLGAVQAGWQPQDDVRVMLDPDGHPFCLFLPGA
jgi:catechol 2,3-dioxygenase-like lactoylglutathione lyase family enzyme